MNIYSSLQGRHSPCYQCGSRQNFSDDLKRIFICYPDTIGQEEMISLFFYVYRFGIDNLNCTVEDLAESRGIKESSFIMRLGNFAAVDGKGGLVHFGRITEQVYRQYINTDENTLRRLAFPKFSE